MCRYILQITIYRGEEDTRVKNFRGNWIWFLEVLFHAYHRKNADAHVYATCVDNTKKLADMEYWFIEESGKMKKVSHKDAIEILDSLDKKDSHGSQST